MLKDTDPLVGERGIYLDVMGFAGTHQHNVAGAQVVMAALHMEGALALQQTVELGEGVGVHLKWAAGFVPGVDGGQHGLFQKKENLRVCHFHHLKGIVAFRDTNCNIKME